jgi:hypothetical protein
MKHNKIRTYLKLGSFLISFSILLWNCAEEKDFDSIPQAFGLFDHTDQKVRIVKKQNIPKTIFDFIDFRTSGTGEVVLNKPTEGYAFHSRNTRNNVFGTVDNSKSVVVSLETQTRYTFLVQPSQPSTDEVINLVIIDDGIQTVEYFVKYEFDSNSQVSSAFNTIDMMEFEGTISFYNNEGVLIGNYTMSQGRTTKSSGTGISCDPNDDNTSDDPNDDTSSNDGGSGNGGCTNCGGDGDQNTEEPGDDSDGGTTSGGGEFCSVEIKYYRCNCGGDANGHPPSGEVCCQGSPMTVTITCNEYAGRTSSSSESNVVPFSCDSPIGAIIERDDCQQVKDQTTDFEFNNKINELEGQLGELREYGYAQFADLSYQALDLSPNNTVKIITANLVKGAIHTHPDSLLTINPLTGKQFIGYPVEMFSPEDFKSFIQMVHNADGINFDASEVYSALVTPEGNYMLKFAGNTSDIPSLSTIGTKANDMFYDLYVVEAQDKMTGYLRYLKASLDITNVVIYEFDGLGTVTGKYIDENGEIQTIQC